MNGAIQFLQRTNLLQVICRTAEYDFQRMEPTIANITSDRGHTKLSLQNKQSNGTFIKNQYKLFTLCERISSICGVWQILGTSLRVLAFFQLATETKLLCRQKSKCTFLISSRVPTYFV